MFNFQVSSACRHKVILSRIQGGLLCFLDFSSASCNLEQLGHSMGEILWTAQTEFFVDAHLLLRTCLLRCRTDHPQHLRTCNLMESDSGCALRSVMTYE